MKSSKRKEAFAHQITFNDLMECRRKNILKDYNPAQFEIKFTLKQVSKILLIPARTIVNHIHEGKLESNNLMGYHLIHENDLGHYIMEYHFDRIEICLNRMGFMKRDLIERNYSRDPIVIHNHSIEGCQEIFKDLIDKRELDDDGFSKD